MPYRLSPVPVPTVRPTSAIFAASTGWRFVDGLYATAYNYDDPRFINYDAVVPRHASQAGILRPLRGHVSSLGSSSAAFAAGNTALHNRRLLA